MLSSVGSTQQGIEQSRRDTQQVLGTFGPERKLGIERGRGRRVEEPFLVAFG